MGALFGTTLADMGKLFTRWNTARKLAKGRCDNCTKILPDSGAPCNFHTCSPECALDRWASVTC